MIDSETINAALNETLDLRLIKSNIFIDFYSHKIIQIQHSQLHKCPPSNCNTQFGVVRERRSKVCLSEIKNASEKLYVI